MIDIQKRNENSGGLLYGLASNAPDMLSAWRNAGETPDAKFDELPLLTPEQFAKFYADYSKGKKMIEGSLTSEDALNQSDQLAAEVNYHDSSLKKVSWIQFMVYMCAGKIKPLDKIYRNKSRKRIFRKLRRKLRLS